MNKNKLRLVVLDRDGVINQDSPAYIKSPEEWHAIPGSLEAIAKLNRAGFLVVVASNQSGLGRGYLTPETLNKIHQKMERELAAVGGKLDGIFICPHSPEDHCDCRKPKPGLLFQIIDKFGTKPEEMLSIGDSMRDLLAAKTAGIPAVLVKTGNGQVTFSSEKVDVPVFDDLAAVADAILLGSNFC